MSRVEVWHQTRWSLGGIGLFVTIVCLEDSSDFVRVCETGVVTVSLKRCWLGEVLVLELGFTAVSKMYVYVPFQTFHEPKIMRILLVRFDDIHLEGAAWLPSSC